MVSHRVCKLLLNQNKIGDIMLNSSKTSHSFNTSLATYSPLQIPSSRVIKKIKKTFHPPIIDPNKQ